jgi:hypothetical protein
LKESGEYVFPEEYTFVLCGNHSSHVKKVCFASITIRKPNSRVSLSLSRAFLSLVWEDIKEHLHSHYYMYMPIVTELMENMMC